MTAKRYHKLFRALMTEVMAGQPKAGKCIYAAAHAKPNFDEKAKGYKEIWEDLIPDIDPETYKASAYYIAKNWSSGRR